MTAKQLTDGILQMAIQGKLVPQDPNDEPASVLLERIREEKRRLVAEGKLKKKDLEETPISEKEIPFDIPESWEWVRLHVIFDFIDYRGSTPNKINIGIPLVTAKNVKRGYNDYSIKEYISEKEFEARKGRGVSKRGDILFTTEAPLGNVSLADLDVFSAGQRLITLQAFSSDNINNKLLMSFMLSPSFMQFLLENKTGTTVAGIKASRLKDIMIPLPPLAEQHRIVERIDEYLPVIKEYGEAYDEASMMDAELPDKLKKSILQEAIMGKLGTQDSSDAPASCLLEDIRAEKQEFVREGKLKRKDLEENTIEEDEAPFAIPASWEWCRLGWLVDFSKSNSTASDSIDDESWLLDLEDIEKDSGRLLVKKRMKDVRSLSDKRKFYKGNVLYSKLRPYLNKVIVADEDGYCTTEILAFDFGKINNKYAQYYLMSPYFVNYAMSGSFGTKMPRLGSKHGNEAPFPLPPLAEQHRIVQKIEELFAEIDNMTSNNIIIKETEETEKD